MTGTLYYVFVILVGCCNPPPSVAPTPFSYVMYPTAFVLEADCKKDGEERLKALNAAPQIQYVKPPLVTKYVYACVPI